LYSKEERIKTDSRDNKEEWQGKVIKIKMCKVEKEGKNRSQKSVCGRMIVNMRTKTTELYL
jgi:hypothetical protein